ncbi:hypothetical protein [Actinacidiphila oryziradicis]|uniref:Uncharacterized protein n=1 Tax=Actinacidiphila oryziradicis TaxID=2571141 RepID=A0A4U0SNX6_9ACTN|nr:hypothetical protein [Actinacidiphila oryziradicis]TKA11730.1 hypothetical protein FCI23_10390 [Actinacidiphila oryziradicis]
MARQPKDVKIAGAFVTPGERAAWVRTSDDTAVPSNIQALLHLDEPPVAVQMVITVDAGARAIIREFAVSPRERDVPISTSLLRRIPVDYLLRVALDRASVSVKRRPDIHEGAFQLRGDPEHQAWVSPAPPKPGRGHEASADRVQQAADVYKQALASGSRSPGMEVATAMGYSRATAARDIRLARERGLLAAAESGESAAEAKLPPPSSDVLGPVWQRFGDPDSWAPMDEVLAGPMGLPVVHPGITGAAAPDPVPDASRRRDAEQRLRRPSADAQSDSEDEGGADEDAGAADE